MSLMQNGKPVNDWLEAETEGGEFVRKASRFRHWVTSDGSAGPSGHDGFRAEPGRYHLYVSLACPWAQRTLIVRKLKRLEDIISVSVVHPHMLDKGWGFGAYPGATGDSLYACEYLYQLYLRTDPDYSGIVSVPVLWDKQRETIVNNESSEIMRMLNTAFDQWGDSDLDLYPRHLRAAIDEINARVYSDINNGVYRTGFARTQAAYERNLDRLFRALDDMDAILDHRRYLTGVQITEADWRLFTTLLRFDAVYYLHFKCNLRRISDYPNLSNYLRELYQWPGIAETVNFDHIKQHYYISHPRLDPTGIVPKGPLLDLSQPHNRAAIGN